MRNLFWQFILNCRHRWTEWKNRDFSPKVNFEKWMENMVHCDCTRSQDLYETLNCKKCGGTGWVSTDAEKQARIKRLRAEKDDSPQSRKENG